MTWWHHQWCHGCVKHNLHNLDIPNNIPAKYCLCGTSPSYLNRPDKHRDKQTHTNKHTGWKHYHLAIAVAGDKNIKAPRHWPLCGEFTGDRWISQTNGQWREKCFHLMMSSCIGGASFVQVLPASLNMCIMDHLFTSPSHDSDGRPPLARGLSVWDDFLYPPHNEVRFVTPIVMDGFFPY